MSSPLSDPATPEAPDTALPPSLRLLKWLVVLLTLTMIGGVISVVGLLVTRMPQTFAAQTPALPAGLQLPEGARPAAVTFGTGWTVIVTDDDRILIYGTGGTLRQELRIEPEAGP